MLYNGDFQCSNTRMDHEKDPLTAAVSALGYAAIARECEKSPAAVRKWTVVGLPRSEWTRETDFAKRIGKMLKDRGFAKRALEFHAKKRADLLAQRKAA